jgi:hypothetical protein
MNKKQQKQVAIQKAVMEVMEKHLTKWQSVTELKRKYDRFVRNLKKIDDYYLDLQKHLAPLKQSKRNSRKALLEQLFPIASVVGVFAYDMGDRKLGKNVDMKLSELKKMKADALEKYCFKVLKISGSLLEPTVETASSPPKHAIADYGLTPKHLESLQLALENSIRDEEEFSKTKLSKKKSKAKLEQRVRENNILLKKKMDRMIRLLRESQKTFYADYIKSRIHLEADTTKGSVEPPAGS